VLVLPACARRAEPQGGGLDARHGHPAPRARGQVRRGRARRRTRAFAAAEQAVREGRFDEIIVSTLPKRKSTWLRKDLIRRIESLGLPVTAVVPKQTSLRDAIEDSDDVSRGLLMGG
jgi:hypothetical protein